MKIYDFIKKYKIALQFIFLFIIIVFVYGQTLKFDYTYFDDDVLILHNQDFISNYKNIPKFFTKSVFYSGNGSFYRPVLTMSFALDAMIAGKNPFIYHLSSLLLHVIVSFLLFIFLKKLKIDEIFIFLFTSLFVLHPAFAHAVAWIPGRNDLLLAVFVLSAMIFLFNYFESGKKYISNLILFFLMFAAAMFTKESAAAMLFVVPVFMHLFCKKPSKKSYLTVFFISFLIFCAYMIIRSLILGEISDSAAFNILKSLKSLLIYCEYIVLPLRIYLFPENNPTGLLTAFAGLILLIPVAASLFFDIGRKKLVLFGIFWFLIFLLPSFMASNYVISLLPHRLYVAAAGFLIMFSEFFSAVSKKYFFTRKYIIVFLSALVVLFGLLSYLQASKYENKYVYLSNAINEQPDSGVLRIKMAEYYSDEGKFEEAKNEIHKVKKNEDGTYSVQYYEILAYIYSLEGSYEMAIEIFEQLIGLFPDHESSLNNLSEIYFITGEYKKALEYADRLISIRPEHSAYKAQYAKIKNKHDSSIFEE